MKFTSAVLVLGFFIFSAHSIASTNSPNVIYGEDNRKDVFESTNASFIELAKSTAAMIDRSQIQTVEGGFVKILGQTLQARGICAKERFSKQVSGANCSGFLVSNNMLVTAGHCMTSAADCRNSKWVFDYKVDFTDQGEVKVAQSSVYGCKKIIAQKLEQSTKDDYALIELERIVEDRHPVKFRKSGKISTGEALVVIGHPTGLPTKIADGANVRSLSNKFFTANLDTYGGNSGSAVFNVQTEEVEGILVRGENDYVRDSVLTCQVSNVCPNTGCQGEEVTYITNIPELKNIR